MSRGFDALSVPNISQYRTLHNVGFDLACGYTRALTIDAVDEALGVGMAVLPIDEAGDPTTVGYFTTAQAQADATRFLAWADSVSMPRGYPFVGLTLDFDCQISDLPAILPYVNTKINAINGLYPMWAYGPYDPIEYMARGLKVDGTFDPPWGGIAGFMQAYAPAWSQNRNGWAAPSADIFQCGGATISGISLDVQVVRTGAALWRLR